MNSRNYFFLKNSVRLWIDYFLENGDMAPPENSHKSSSLQMTTLADH